MTVTAALALLQSHLAHCQDALANRRVESVDSYSDADMRMYAETVNTLFVLDAVIVKLNEVIGYLSVVDVPAPPPPPTPLV